MATNRRRLDWFREYYKARLDSISHVVLYNSGSVLNPREMPPELLDHILAAIRSFPSTRSSRWIRAEIYHAGDRQANRFRAGSKLHGAADHGRRIGGRPDPE